MVNDEPPKKIVEILFSTLKYIEKKKNMFHIFSSGFDEGDNARHASGVENARLDVLKQKLLLFLKSHAVTCTPSIQSRCIGTYCQLETPDTESMADPFSLSRGLGACSMGGIQTIKLRVTVRNVLIA
jgi:hypothetical protein